MKLPVLVPALVLALAGATESADDRPNFIVIYTDDHGYSDLGIHGLQPDLKTPHLDALARSGVVMKHGYSTAPQCVPSRGGLLTGRFQGRFGLDNNNSPLDGFNRQTTLAERLRDAGYETAQFGKWHLGPNTEIVSHGFKHVFSQNAQRPFAANISIDGSDRPMGDLPPDEYHLSACAKAAAAIIDRYRDRPFFLYLAFRGPHTPLDAPQVYKDRFPGAMPERRRAALADEGEIIIFTPENKGRGGFLTKTRVKLAGPLKVRLVLKATPGNGSVTWRVEGDKDFQPSNRVAFTLDESDDWQVREFDLPATGSVIHLRVQVPPGSARFRTLQFKPAGR